jgi:hypothetical protein
MYIGDIEITKREILSSIAIILVMLMIGFGIHSAIVQNIIDNNEVYNKAIKLTSADEFIYGMKTNIGNAFVQGELSAVDPVSYPDLTGKYMYVSKETQRYTMHTRTVTYTDSNGKVRTKTETYWTWDRIDFDSKTSKEVFFNTIKFNTSQFDIPYDYYIDTIRNGNIRYIYKGVDLKHNGTILACLKNNNIFNINNEKKKIPFHTQNLQETYDYYISSGTAWLALFWFFWILLIIGALFFFYQFENRWLE